MDKKIMCLGFRGDTRYIVSIIKDAVDECGAGLDVFGVKEKFNVQRWLERGGSPIHGACFATKNGTDGELEFYTMPQYRCDSVAMFVCSNVTREGTGDDAGAVYDGEEFARLILPESPKLLLHFQNHYTKGHEIPDAYRIRADFDQNMYHLRRDLSDVGDINLKTFVSTYFTGEPGITYDAYMDLLRPE